MHFFDGLNSRFGIFIYKLRFRNVRQVIMMTSSSTSSSTTFVSASGADKVRAELPSVPKVNPTLVREWDEIQDDVRKRLILCDTEDWQFNKDLRYNLHYNKGRRLPNLINLCIFLKSGLNRVAGVDISVHARDHSAEECDAIAAVVICKFPTMEILHEETQKIRLNVPYVPG